MLFCICCAAEQLHEGDVRRLKKMEVAALYDRFQMDVPRNQRGFIVNFNIKAAFESLAAIAPAFGDMALQHLDANVLYYSTLVEQHVTTL